MQVLNTYARMLRAGVCKGVGEWVNTYARCRGGIEVVSVGVESAHTGVSRARTRASGRA